MEPFIFIDKTNLNKTLCDDIISLEPVSTIIPLYPEESSEWYSITNHIIDKLENAIQCFIQKHSLNIYNMHNIIQNSDFLQANMVIYKGFDDNYHNDFIVTNHIYSTISYIWCLESKSDIIFGKSHKITMEKGDLLLFPASWEYPYKLDADGIYLKGTLYTSYE